MASITKLMTAIVALEELRPRRTVTIDSAAVGVIGSSIFLRAGERLSVRDLLAAALIQSANDAAYALAAANDRRRRGRLRPADEPDGPGARSRRHALRQPGRARRAGALLLGAGSPRARARGDGATHRPQARSTGRRDDRRWQEPLFVERSPRNVSRRLRRQDRAHERRGLVPGRGGAPRQDRRLRGHPRQPGAHDPERRPRRAPHVRARPLRTPAAGRGGGDVRERLGAVRGRPAGAARRRRERAEGHPPRPSAAPSGRRAARPRPAGRARASSVGFIRVTQAGELVAEVPLVAGRDVEEPDLGGGSPGTLATLSTRQAT